MLALNKEKQGKTQQKKSAVGLDRPKQLRQLVVVDDDELFFFFPEIIRPSRHSFSFLSLNAQK